jgi:hypothetical protein
VSKGHLFAGGSDHVIYPGTQLEVTCLVHKVDLSFATPWPDLAADYELFAEEMEPVRRCLRVSAADLRTAFGISGSTVHFV